MSDQTGFGPRPPANPMDVAFEIPPMITVSYGLLFAFATRAAAVFVIATATIGIKSGTFPRWFARTGYVLGAVLLIGVVVWDWVILVLFAWVAVVSVFILHRERSLPAGRP